MKITKAIEILTDITHQRIFNFEGDENTAIKLGAEALKRLQFMRSYNINQALAPLPSE